MSDEASEVGRRLFSIGHSNHPLQTFLGLLKLHQIEILVDARSYPYSKYASHFDIETLKAAVGDAGIKYLFLGKELGGRPEGTEFYDAEGHVLYSRVAESPLFLEGIRRLNSGIKKYRIAILCSEEDPSSCHRHLLIGRVLSSHGIVLDHIRGDGRVQTEAELMKEAASRCHDNRQATLFAKPEETTWRSIQSVLPRGPRPTSSGR